RRKPPHRHARCSNRIAHLAATNSEVPLMKTLLILRHAKSSHDHPEIADHDRPLNKRGRRDAPHVGEMLVEKKLVPDQILCSTAVRARETTDLVVGRFHKTPPIQYRSDLYLAPPKNYVHALNELDDSVETVLTVGHNPGLEAWVESLSGEPSRFPTAALA